MLDQNVLVVQNVYTMLILIDGNAGAHFRATQSEAGPRSWRAPKNQTFRGILGALMF